MQRTSNYNFKKPEGTDFALISDLSDNWEDADGIIHRIDEEEFNQVYSLCNKTTTIGKSEGNKVITETDTDTGIEAVTTIVKTSDTVKTITTVVTTDDAEYTKTTIATKTLVGKTINETYTKTTI